MEAILNLSDNEILVHLHRLLANATQGGITNQITSEFDDILTHLSKAENKSKYESIINNNTSPLLIKATQTNCIGIVTLLLKYDLTNVNIIDRQSKSTPLLVACLDNNLALAKLLMSKGANPNLYNKSNFSVMHAAARNNNKQIMEIVLNKDKKYKYSFDWNELINLQTNLYTAFIYACQFGSEQCLKYLMNEENEYKTEIDVLGKQKNKWNGLYAVLAGCDNAKIAEYLIKNIYVKQYNDGKYDINEVDWKKRTALTMTCHKGNVAIVELLYQNFPKLNPNVKARNGSCALMQAINHDSVKCVSYLINNTTINKIECNVNAVDDQNETALMKCIVNDSLQSFKALCGCNRVRILDIRRQSDNLDAMEMCVYYGQTEMFQILLLTLFKRLNINDWNSFIESNLINENKIEQWRGWCQQQKNDGFLSFLINIEKIFNGKDNNSKFSLLYAMLGVDNDINDNNNSDSGDYDMYNNLNEELMKDLKISNYLFENCDKTTLTNLVNVINQGLLKQECFFNDSLLFLSNKVNNKEFIKTIEECTKLCLGNENGSNIKDVYFFKNNFIESKIWGLTASSSNSNDNSKDINFSTISDLADEKKENNDSNDDGNVDNKSNNGTIFDRIKLNVINKELLKQKEYLQKEIMKQEKDFNESWQDLKDSILYYNIGADYKLSQNKLLVDNKIPILRGKDLMQDGGIKCDYLEKQLPFDNANGFVGTNEYDYNCYLTKLLIASFSLNPIFQQACQNIFDNNRNVLNCHYIEAPPKTKDRCLMKSKLDYFDRKWPHSSHILDFIRCSVIFNSAIDLVNGLNKFKNIIRQNRGDICIKQIVRIKNDFNNLKTADATNINQFDYCDVKCNVLIEYNGVKLIGEIQFILKFMQHAKKLGHKVYSFLRNEDYFGKISKMINEMMNDNKNNDSKRKEKIKKIILTRNLKHFSMLLQFCTEIDKQYLMKNKAFVDQFLKDNHWKQGIQMWDLFVKYWNKSN